MTHLAVVTSLALALLAPRRETPGTLAEARALLDKATDSISRFGEVESLERFNAPKGRFRHKDLFVFCFGPDDKVTAHQTLPLGSDIKTLKDADGREIGKELSVAAVMGDGAVEFRAKDPQTGLLESRVSLVRRTGSQVCGVSVVK